MENSEIKLQLTYEKHGDSYWQKSLIWILKANLAVWAINVVLVAVLFFRYQLGQLGLFFKNHVA